MKRDESADNAGDDAGCEDTKEAENVMKKDEKKEAEIEEEEKVT